MSVEMWQLSSLSFLLVLWCANFQVNGQHDCYNILKPTVWLGTQDTFCFWDNNCDTCPSEGDPDYGTEIINSYFYEDNLYNHTEIEGQVCKLIMRPGILPHCRYFGFYVPCDVRYCHEHAGCYNKETNGSDYRGLARYTESGYLCLHWSGVLHSFNETAQALEENYCRNPDGSERPWCYYMANNQTIGKDFCVMPNCTTDVLSDFRRKQNTYPLSYRVISSYVNLDLLVLDVEEQCAQRCVDEERFECRSFYVGLTGYCLLSGAGAIYDGEYIEEYQQTGGDLFFRKSTRCHEVIPLKYPDHCMLPLGMEGIWIEDSQISVTSEIDSAHGAVHARLNGPSSWVPAVDDPQPAITITFVNRMIITGVVLQAGSHMDHVVDLVDNFTIDFDSRSEFSNNPQITYLDESSYPKVLPGIFYEDCPQPVFFEPPIWTYSIRIKPLSKSSTNPFALRLEVLGCQDNDCDKEFGFMRGPVDGISVSDSEDDAGLKASSAALRAFDYKASGWIMPSEHSWVQMSVSEPFRLSAMISRKCSWPNAWVSRFRLWFGSSERLESGEPIINELTDIFNVDYHGTDVSKIQFSEPFELLEVVRLYPVDTPPVTTCLRIELVGCNISNCKQRLGMETRLIEKGNLSCKGCNETTIDQARLHHFDATEPFILGFTGCVLPTTEVHDIWFQITFDDVHVFSGIMIQGGMVNGKKTYIPRVKVAYTLPLSSASQENLRQYKTTSGETKNFENARDPYTVSTHWFERTFLARAIRINIDSDMTQPGVIRLELIGCPLDDPNKVCGSNEYLHNGFCYGVIDEEGDMACDNIFLPGSHPVNIKSQAIQTFITNNSESLLQDRADRFVIGLKREEGEGFKWNDGTPLDYSELVPADMTESNVCVYMDAYACFSWKTYDCSPQQRAVICQYDIDECLGTTHGCRYNCKNTPGSYYCVCPPGYRRASNNRCIDICSVNNGTALPFDTNTGLCVSTDGIELLEKNEANQRCINQNKKLLGDFQELTAIQRARIFSYITDQAKNISSWPFVWYNANNEEVDDNCHVLNFTINGSLNRVSCDERFSFICVTGYKVLNMDRVWETNDLRPETGWIETDITAPFGHMEFLGFAPWYGTNIAAPTLIKILTDRENSSIRLSFHHIYLRQSEGRCIDELNINLGSKRGNWSSICGYVEEDLVLIPTGNEVEMILNIGNLTSDIDKEIGFSLTYEAIDCTDHQCSTGCGQTKVTMIGNDTLQTWPFPSMFQPYSYCFYEIVSPSVSDKNLYIVMEFTEYIFKRHGHKCYDAITLEGKSSVSPVDTQRIFDCDVTPPLQVTSWTRMKVILTTGLQSESEGFIAKYSFSEKPGCNVGYNLPSSLVDGESICTEPSGVIATVGYPSYENKPNLWEIVTERNTYIQVTNFILDFEEIDSESRSCHSELRITEDDDNGKPEVNSYCPVAMPLPEQFLSRRNELTIELHLMDSGRAKFYAEYQSLRFPYIPDIVITGYDCPKGWSMFYGHCYQIFSNDTAITWLEAEELCAGKGPGSHLASIKGSGGMKFLQYKLTSDWLLDHDYKIYIGLKRSNNVGNFRWTDDSPMSFSAWYHPANHRQATNHEGHQPNGSDLEECAMISLTQINSLNQWHDITCSRPTAKHFICKKPSTSVDTGELYNTNHFSGTYNPPAEISSCAESLFQCDSGECIQKIFVCDGISQCSNGSDERGCIFDEMCPVNFFACTTGQCLPVSFLCDNKNDCEDNSDERQCHHVPCLDGEVPCQHEPNKCIPISKVCDITEDCIFGTDEDYCDEAAGLFHCYSGRKLPFYARCDGMVDCIGNAFEDELDCDYQQQDYTCDPDDQLQCENGKCVDLSIKCIYDVDSLGYIIGCRDVYHLHDCVNFTCPPYTFSCPLSYCIPLRMRCDGVKDCPNGQDELECNTGQYTCPPSTFACHPSGGKRICLEPNQVCDGEAQCPDKDDELYCDFACPVNCTCVGLSVSCERPAWQVSVPPVFHRDIRTLRITDVLLTLEPIEEDSPTQYVVGWNATHKENDLRFSLRLSDLPYLAHLDLISTGIDRLDSAVFRNNSNLFKLNLSGNALSTIEKGALDPLKNLKMLDIKNTNVEPGPKNKDLFSGINDTLSELHVDSFVFCCLVDESLVKCNTNKDRFSSCSNLLKNDVLRILMWILGISALIGNSFVICYRILQQKRVENSAVQSHLISNLAVSDLLMGVYMMIIAAKDESYRGDYYLHSQFWRNSPLCRAAGFMSMLSSEVSVFLVMIISLDRLFCVVFPFRQKLHLTPKKCLIVIVATWVLSFLLSLAPLLVPSYQGHFYGQSSVCLALPLTGQRSPGWEYSVFIFLGINFFSFMVTLVCYIMIFAEVYRSSARMAGRKQQTTHSRRLNGQIKLATKMALIVGTDFCCWMPVIIMGILAKAEVVEIPSDMYAWSAVILLPLNSAINPYLYTLSSLQQRRKQRLRTKSLATNMSLQDVNTKTEISIDQTLENSSSDNACPQKVNPLYAALAKHCVLTPFTRLNALNQIQTLTEYINQRGTMPSTVDSALIRRDITKALTYLKSRSVVDLEPAEEKIAIQLSSAGDVRQAFFVVYNAKDVQRLLKPNTKPSNLNNHLSDQREFVKTMLDELMEKDENLKPKDDNLKSSQM